MNVSDTGVLGVADEAADLEIFTDGHDLLRQSLGDGQAGVGVLAIEESFDVCGVVVDDDMADVLDEVDERLALCAEVGLAVDLDDSADAALGANVCISHTFGSNAAGLLCGLCKALLTQPFDCLIHIAVGLGEGLLAVHHADVGHLAESFNILSGKCHNNLSSCFDLILIIH